MLINVLPWGNFAAICGRVDNGYSVKVISLSKDVFEFILFSTGAVGERERLCVYAIAGWNQTLLMTFSC